MNTGAFPISNTICWDCANATGGCSWSKSLVPVEGWKAIKTKKQTVESYAVYDCPEFKRDAMGNGLRRLPKECIIEEN